MFVSPYLITISFETFFINLPVVKTVKSCVLILNLFGFFYPLPLELLKLETNSNTFTHRITMVNVQKKDQQNSSKSGYVNK